MHSVILIFLAVSATVTASAQDHEVTRKTLAGLPGVQVLVEQLGTAEGRGGLFARDIKSDVESELRQAGIVVLTPDLNNSLSAPTLYVQLNVMVPELAANDGIAVYFINVTLQQNTMLIPESRGAAISAGTWDVGSFGRIGDSRLWELRQDVIEKVSRPSLTPGLA